MLKFSISKVCQICYMEIQNSAGGIGVRCPNNNQSVKSSYSLIFMGKKREPQSTSQTWRQMKQQEFRKKGTFELEALNKAEI